MPLTKILQLTGVADGLCYLHRHDVVHGDLKGVRRLNLLLKGLYFFAYRT